MDQHDPMTIQSGAGGRVTIPDAKAIPKPEKTPAYKQSIKNFADNEETAKMALAWIKGYYDDFKSRSARVKFASDADVADEMYRAAKNRLQLNEDESENVNPTASKVKSSSFYTDIRLITAGQKAIILGNEEDLPMRFEPLSESKGPAEDRALAISEDRNFYLSYVMEVAKLRTDIAKALLYTNKYSMQVLEMGWDYRREEREERVPVDWSIRDNAAVPVRFKWEKKIRTVADNPIATLHDWRNAWWDPTIFDIQNQQCVIFRRQRQYEDIVSQQGSGEYLNCEKITARQLYQGENGNPGLPERQSNAGDEEDSETPNGLYDIFRGYCRLPIDTDTGKWDPKKVVSTWFEYVFCGNIDDSVVCLQITPLRYKKKKIPVRIIYSHEDDKGSIRMGYATLAKSIIAQEMTIFDQYFDNNTWRNQAPMIMDRGSINIRDRTYSAAGNRIWFIKPGARFPNIVQTQDTTQQTVPMVNMNDERRRRTLGTLKAFEGIAAGGRTSATESTLDFQQAIKPALEDTKYIADQMLPFMGEWIWDMTEQFGDPKQQLQITMNGVTKVIRPSELYGPYRVRVTAVKNFEDNLVAQQRDNQFLSQIFPIYAQTPNARPEVPLRQIFTRRGYENVDEWWAQDDPYDARHVAESENVAILWQGIIDFPKPGENHEAHNQVHENGLAAVMLLPETELPPMEYINNLKAHIQQTQRLMQQGAAPQMGGSEGVAPQLAGEVQGDLAGAEAGALENLPAQGRPPEIERATREEENLV